jgi:hypothetical protein
VSPVETAGTLSLGQRALAVFSNPSRAWAGLETRAQWWFPLLLMIVINLAGLALLYERALVPTQEAQWDRMVESGQMQPEQIEAARAASSSPAMRAVTLVGQAITWFVIVLLGALAVWFGVGFLLGSKLSFRLALEVCSWSSLVLIPSVLITSVLAWFRGTYEGLHLSLAALLPEGDAPSRLMTGVRALLDGLGPFSIWWLVVAILGASALARAPLRSVAWVMSGIMVGFALVAAALAAVFAPGAS